MKRGVKRAALIGTVAALALPLGALAAEYRAGENVVVQSGESISSNTYLLASHVTSSGTVTKDLMVAGGSVLVNGPVWVDLTAAGGNISVNSDVGDDLRAAGGTITLQGSVKNDAVLAGGTIVANGKSIGGDLFVAGGEITINQPVGGDVRIYGGSVVINAPIQGSVEIRASSVTLGPAAKINGDLAYTAQKEATMQEGATVGGQTQFTKSNAPSQARAAGLAALFSLWTLGKLLMMIIGAFALYFFFPRYTREIAHNAGAHPLPLFGIGIVFLAAVPIIALILFATLIGAQLGILLLLAYAAVLVFSSILAPIIAGAIAGNWLWKRGFVVSWQTIFLGIFIYFILGFIPLLGWIAKLIVYLLALGTALHLKWGIAKQWR